MLSPTLPQSPMNRSNSVRILESRSQYRSCHIRLPGDEQRTAAILFEGKLYGLIKVVKDRKQALEICDRLATRGGTTLITTIAKGDAIWRLEPDASLELAPQVRSHNPAKTANTATCRILGTNHQPPTCYIVVPDLEQRLEAIRVDGNYYALFKVVETRQQALELSARLGQRGDSTIITRSNRGDTIWVLEVDARPASVLI